MSSTNRRHGGSNRPPHLTVAPSPDSTAPTVTSTTSALAEEDAPLSTAGQVTIMLTPEEFRAAGRRAARLTQEGGRGMRLRMLATRTAVATIASLGVIAAGS